MILKPAHYQIRVQGHLDQDWQDWFHGLVIAYPEAGVTLLSGTLIDQAALHGILTQLYDLGFPLLSVHEVVPVREVVADDQHLHSPFKKDEER